MRVMCVCMYDYYVAHVLCVPKIVMYVCVICDVVGTSCVHVMCVCMLCMYGQYVCYDYVFVHVMYVIG